ncbi:GATA transcription factor 11 [Sesamum angolense]|uniref:GATA transcription factor 11 n=1 Tax=Sesamum angolense TaxID=2727404 RepID=A0AAE1XCH1_9LAMI|nr:GATA transcription factor 11 [Sesamum angolense]
MGMVEPGNCWDAVASGVAGDEEFESILSILDFPMESLDGDGFVEDWDISKSQCLGPIPSNVLFGPPMIPNGKIDTGPPNLLPGPVAPIVAVPEHKLPSNYVEASGSHILQQNKFADVQESGFFQTQSPVSVLESGGSCPAGKNLPIKSHNAIPVRTRSKRVRHAGVNPWLLVSPWFAATSTSKRTSNARKNKEARKKPSQPSVVVKSTRDSPEKVENSLQLSDYAEPQNVSSHRPALAKKCTHCEVTKTPQWREGPLGPKTLCNACGVRFRSGRLFPEYRPAASPTFVPSLHSNSHKKVIEMRSKTKQPATKLEEPPISPQPEFVPMSSYLFDYIH